MWRTALFVWFQIVRNISKRRTSSQTPRPESAGRTGSLAGSRNRLSAGGFLLFPLYIIQHHFLKKELIKQFGVDKLNESAKKLEKDISNN